MHKIIVPPSQPSTYYESRYRLTAIYHFGNFLIVLYTATIKYPFFPQLNNMPCNIWEIPAFMRAQAVWSSRHHLLDRTAAHDADCYGSIHVSLLQARCYTGTDCCPWLYKAKHSQTWKGVAPEINGPMLERTRKS